MPSNYKLMFTQVANEDLDQIYSYISSNLSAETAADNLLNKIEDTILQLKHFPQMGSYIADEMLKSKGYRKLVINNYLVLYLIDEQQEQVVIMRIVYGAQQYEQLL